MKTSDMLAVALVALALWTPGGLTPAVPDSVIPTPDAAAQKAVLPIQALLDPHDSEAAEVAAFYRAAAGTIERDGGGAKVLKNTRDLRTFCERAVILRFQGAFAKVPGLADAIHGEQGALAALVGLDAAELDHVKAAAAFNAVAWAAQEAAK